MTNTDTHFVFINYLEAFATTSHAERERLLRSSLAENVVYTNPGAEGSGIDNLLRHIEGFQKKFPGGRFRMNWLRQQHGQAVRDAPFNTASCANGIDILFSFGHRSGTVLTT